MPETMSPGAMPPPAMMSTPSAQMAAPSTSFGARYPDTEMFGYGSGNSTSHM
jgi:hypothetical protein